MTYSNLHSADILDYPLDRMPVRWLRLCAAVMSVCICTPSWCRIKRLGGEIYCKAQNLLPNRPQMSPLPEIFSWGLDMRKCLSSSDFVPWTMKGQQGTIDISLYFGTP